MSATPSERRRAGLIWSLLALLALLGAAGLVRLTIAPAAPYRLPPEHPVERATLALREATGGDDVLLVAVFAERSLLDEQGVRAIEAIREGMASTSALEGVRAVTTAPLLAIRDGVLSAETPLLPTPSSDAAERVLADRFAVGPLVGETGRVALIPGWIRRLDASAALVARATNALKDPALRATEAGGAVSRAVNEARLAALLGGGGDSPDTAVAAALRGLAAGGVAAELVSGWEQAAERAAADPAGEALGQVRQAVGAVVLPDGLRAVVLGAPAVTEAVAEAFPVGVALLLLGLALGAGLASGRSHDGLGPGVRASGAAVIAALITAGVMGWAGAPLHGVTALGPVLAAALAGVLAGAARDARLQTPVGVLPLLGLAVGMMPVEGGLTAGLAGVTAGALVGVLVRSVEGTPRAVSPGPGGPRAIWSPAAHGALILALGCGASLVRPVGLDPGRLLDGRHAVGAATAALDADAGMAAPAQLVLVGEGDRAMAAPASLRALRDAQGILEAAEGVRGTVSWADFVGSIHELVGQAAPASLPEDPALVDQYLLLFGRPDATRPLVAPDLSVGSGLVRLEPGQGARLARLAGLLDGSPVSLAGEATRIAVASRRTVRVAAGGLLVGLLLAALLAVGVDRSRGALEDLLVTTSACLVAAATAAWWANTVSLEALAAAGLVFVAGRALPRAGLALLGAGLAALSPVVPLAALGLGVAAGGAALLGLRALR